MGSMERFTRIVPRNKSNLKSEEIKKLKLELKECEGYIEKYKKEIEDRKQQLEFLESNTMDNQVVEIDLIPLEEKINDAQSQLGVRIDDAQNQLGGKINLVQNTLEERVLEELTGNNQRVVDDITENGRNMLTEHEKKNQLYLDEAKEHTHAECIKVYRNVQAVVVEENAKQNQFLNDVGDDVDKIKSRLSLVMIFSIISFVVSALVMLMQILPRFGINLF